MQPIITIDVLYHNILQPIVPYITIDIICLQPSQETTLLSAVHTLTGQPAATASVPATVEELTERLEECCTVAKLVSKVQKCHGDTVYMYLYFFGSRSQKLSRCGSAIRCFCLHHLKINGVLPGLQEELHNEVLKRWFSQRSLHINALAHGAPSGFEWSRLKLAQCKLFDEIVDPAALLDDKSIRLPGYEMLSK